MSKMSPSKSGGLFPSVLVAPPNRTRPCDPLWPRAFASISIDVGTILLSMIRRSSGCLFLWCGCDSLTLLYVPRPRFLPYGAIHLSLIVIRESLIMLGSDRLPLFLLSCTTSQAVAFCTSSVVTADSPNAADFMHRCHTASWSSLLTSSTSP